MRTILFPTSCVTSHIKENLQKNHVSRFKNLSYFLLSPEAPPYGADLWSVYLSTEELSAVI